MKQLVSIESFSALSAGFANHSLAPEWHLLVTHDLLRDKRDLPWRDRLYRLWRLMLASLRLAPPYVSNYDWSPLLKHIPRAHDGQVLVIWSVGVGDNSLQRAACLALQEVLSRFSSLLPVLLTDCADFAFFSRLGWHVEYLPALSGEGEDYTVRKCAYLAWCYRGALVLPLGDDTATRLVDMAGDYSTGAAV